MFSKFIESALERTLTVGINLHAHGSFLSKTLACPHSAGSGYVSYRLPVRIKLETFYNGS